MNEIDNLLLALEPFDVVFSKTNDGRAEYKAKKPLPDYLQGEMGRLRLPLRALVNEGFAGVYPWWCGYDRTEPRRAYRKPDHCKHAKMCQNSECELYPIEEGICVERVGILCRESKGAQNKFTDTLIAKA